jgi:hypothetical protein
MNRVVISPEVVKPCPKCGSNLVVTERTEDGLHRVECAFDKGCGYQGPNVANPTWAVLKWNDIERDEVGHFKILDAYPMPNAAPTHGGVRSEGEMYGAPQCEDWYGSDGRSCRLPVGHDGPHVDDGFEWGSTLMPSRHTFDPSKPIRIPGPEAAEEPPDTHYRTLGSLQPRDAIAHWSRHWTGPTAFALGNIVKLAARYHLKTNPEYNLAGLKFYVGELERILKEESGDQ